MTPADEGIAAARFEAEKRMRAHYGPRDYSRVGPQITLNFGSLSTACLIAIANALGEEIDYDEVDATPEPVIDMLRRQFNAICRELEGRDVDVTENVICPENM